MMNRMKIMIAYDGSERSQAALSDLKYAGLPRQAETRIVSVAEPFPYAGPPEIAWGTTAVEALASTTQRAEWTVQQGQRQLQRAFPSWDLEAEVYQGYPAGQLAAHAAEWKSELLVISPLNRNTFERVLRGSLSRQVIGSAPCSVRVARNGVSHDSTPLRLLVGYDGSSGAIGAVNEVASRRWPAKTEVRLVTAMEPSWLSRSSRTDDERRRAQWSLDHAARFLRSAGLIVSTSLRVGQPREVLLAEAEEWGAHCIFVGRGRQTLFRRLFQSGTAAAVAVPAPCSVEVVHEENRPRRAAVAITPPAYYSRGAAAKQRLCANL